MWNFTGRQNDVAGNYNNLNGNWISGINFIDSLRLGNQSHISEDAKIIKLEIHISFYLFYWD